VAAEGKVSTSSDFARRARKQVSVPAWVPGQILRKGPQVRVPRSLAHKLAEAKSEGETLKGVEEESGRLLLEFGREAIETTLSLVAERVLLRSLDLKTEGWALADKRRGKRITPWSCRACGRRCASQVSRNRHHKSNLGAGVH